MSPEVRRLTAIAKAADIFLFVYFAAFFFKGFTANGIHYGSVLIPITYIPAIFPILLDAATDAARDRAKAREVARTLPQGSSVVAGDPTSGIPTTVSAAIESDWKSFWRGLGHSLIRLLKFCAIYVVLMILVSMFHMTAFQESTVRFT